MTETLSHPQNAEFKKDPQAEARELSDRLDEAAESVRRIEEMNKDLLAGRSSFYDVTGNLLATVGPDLRAFIEDDEQEGLDEARPGLQALEAYLEALSVEEILRGELTEGGADPQGREQADQEAANSERSAIQIYALGLAKKAKLLDEAKYDQE